MMKKIHCIKFNKYSRFKKSKISYIFDEVLVLSIICDKCDSKDEKKISRRFNWDIKSYWFNENYRGIPNKHIITSRKKHD